MKFVRLDNQAEILKNLEFYDSEFVRSVSGRVGSLDAYSLKLLNNAYVYLICDNDSQVGMMAYYANDYDSSRAFLTSIVIDGSFRGQGYGRRALEYMERHCLELGFKYITLEVDKDNYNALTFYKNLGYSHIVKELEHSIILEKELKMFYWKKLGKLFDPTTIENRPDWCNDFAQGENSIILEDRIRVFFCCRERPNENGQTVSRVSYVDLDKNDPLKIINVSDHPVFEPGKTGAFDEFGTYPFCAIKHEGRVYGYYGGVQRCESIPFTVQIGCVISDDDGDTFHRLGDGPVLTSSLYEPYMVCSPKVRIYNDKWYMFYSAGYKWTKEQVRPEICYKIRMAVSDDGIEWKKFGNNILPDTLGDLESQACGDVIYKNGKYHMFFCYRGHTDFRNNKNSSYRISYASSTDLLNWERHDDLGGIDVSDNESDWDSQMVAYPHLFEAGDDIYMLYLGNNVGKYGFGIAKLVGELD